MAAAAAALERARGALAALEAALPLEDEPEGDVPARLQAQHLVDTRRKHKVLLTQLRVVRLLLGVLETPRPPPAPPALGGAAAAARRRWRRLKGGYGRLLAALGGALGGALAQLRQGRRLAPPLRRALLRRQRQRREAEATAREAAGKRRQEQARLAAAVAALRQRVAARRQDLLRLREALRRQEEAACRAGARCRLLEALQGLRLLPPAATSEPDSERELELRLELEPEPEPGLPPPTLRLRLGPGGRLRLPDPPPCPGPAALLELREQHREQRPLRAELQRLQSRFALDWEPERSRVRLLGGPGGAQASGAVWTLLLEPGYPGAGGVRVLPPPGRSPPKPPPVAAPTLTDWVELLAGASH